MLCAGHTYDEAVCVQLAVLSCATYNHLMDGCSRKALSTTIHAKNLLAANDQTHHAR